VEFIERTSIEIPHNIGSSVAPFQLWPAQRETLTVMEQDRLAMFLKARQLGISWLICGFVLYQSLMFAGQSWLFFSQGQLEADELIRRVAFLHDHHADRHLFPALTKSNTDHWAWSNGSRIRSLAATRKAGRSFTASGVVLDEFAFMQYGPQVFSAVKPTIDAGGKLFIISSADGAGSAYHQMWQEAEAGSNGFRPHFLPWTARPERGPDWRDRIQAESPNLTLADVLREYPATPLEAFMYAAGLIYGGSWSDATDGTGNVSEAAEYNPALDVVWAVDDGYVGSLDPTTKTWTATSHPRTFLLTQERADGTICVFDEDYRVDALEGPHIQAILDKPYHAPAYAVVDKSAAALKGHLHAAGIATMSKAPGVEESIKVMRGMVAADANKRRRILVHPRCFHLRAEMLTYRRTPTGAIVKAFDHGPDALRYLAWIKRHEAAND
jgi:hypothetical protein